ncbi:Fic family protein [Candidatus Pacearchaeota archaeon]|nr:Fic family protein [Candidatus Pacearchaeota archaeon]
MVYHEIRIINGKKQNYLIYNARKGEKWAKKSRFIGYGNMTKKEVNRLREEFEKELSAMLESKNLSKEQISTVENLKKVYNKKISALNPEEFEKFENTFFTELTYNSNAIEGSSLSLAQTDIIINEGLTPEGKTIKEINEAKNHLEAVKFLKDYKGKLNELLILRLHAIILKNISENFAGRYRENPVRIFRSDAEFPEAPLVPQLVKNLVYWYKENRKKIHLFEMAVAFSMKFVSIHPFVDGNGRVSRLLMNFILKKNNYPWINLYVKQRAEYLKAVREANNGEYKPIIKFCLKTLEENLKSFRIM